MTPRSRALRQALETGQRAAHHIGRIVRLIVGAPDYECYASHMRRRHPGAPIASPAEFARQRLEERYSQPGAKCC